MIPGQQTTVPPGAAEEMLLIFDVTDWGDGLGATVKIQPAEGYGEQYWGLVADSRTQAVVWITEGEKREYDVAYDIAYANHCVSAVPLGQWPDYADSEPAWQQMDFQEDKGAYARIEWDAVKETLDAYGDSGQLSAWSLSGVKRFAYTRAVPDFKTQIQFDVTISNAAGTYTVTLSLGETQVASGSRVGNGAITLAAVNGSGITGSVTIAYTADVGLGNCYVCCRWAASYLVHCAVGITAGNFPRTPEATVLDAGRGDTLAATVGPLAAGTYNIIVQAKSDTAITGTNTALQTTLTIPGRPSPPGVPTFNTVGALAVFAASSTTTASYRVYTSPFNGPISYQTVAATAAATTTTVSVDISAFTSTAVSTKGEYRFSVAAVVGGVEDGYRRSGKALVELVGNGLGGYNGNYAQQKPNAPGFFLSGTAGLALTVGYRYDTAEQEAAGAGALLYVFPEGANMASTTAWSTASSTADLSGTGRIRSGTLSATVTDTGWYNYAVRARTTATNGGYSDNTDVLGPVWLAAAAPTAPGNVKAYVVG